MNKFKGYLVDLDDMHLVNTSDSTLLKFFFDEMIMVKISKQSRAKYPIKYCNNQNEILVWQHKGWQTIGHNTANEAIIYMFNHGVEQQLLGSKND